MRKSLSVGLVGAGLLIASCGTAQPAETTAEPSRDPTTTSIVETTEATTPDETTPNADTTDIDPGMAPLIDMAIADLVERLGTSPDGVEVLSARLVTWEDSALGCPDPERVYVPGVIDGSVIELVVDGVIYSYHTGGDIFEPFLCEEPSGEEDEASSSNPLAGTPLELNKPIEKYPDETVPPPGFDD